MPFAVVTVVKVFMMMKYSYQQIADFFNYISQPSAKLSGQQNQKENYESRPDPFFSFVYDPFVQSNYLRLSLWIKP